MRKLLPPALAAIALIVVPTESAPAQVVAASSEQTPLAVLQARFARLQRVARPQSPVFELRLVAPDHSLFDQVDDGFVRLPGSFVGKADPDTDQAEALDFAMLTALAMVLERPQPRAANDTARSVANGLGVIGRSAAETEARRAGRSPPSYLAQPSQPGAASPSNEFGPAMRALFWAKANGWCEARIVAGLRGLAATKPENRIGQDGVLLLKALGPVGWNPDDHCQKRDG